MWIAEQILFQLAHSLYRTEVAHSSEMKNALQHIDAYDAYRAAEINRILEAVKRYRIPITGRTIVDFGCNDGAISAEYLRRGAARVIGVDIDERAIQRARALHHEERLTFVQSAVSTIPLEDRSADAVISYDVFEHVSQPTTILNELYRILTSAGQALIGTWSWWHPFAPHLWAVMPVPWAHVFFSEQTILRVCQRVYHSP
jgi:2-polyprenyl-3-methyl-5-hydroxy-6-metoxy-1,4-benzoquinol methylase